MYAVKKYTLGLPRYNEILGNFTLYRESRYKDIILLLPWYNAIIGVALYYFLTRNSLH